MYVRHQNTSGSIITPPIPILDKDRKLTQFFIFKLLCGASKGFIKAFMAFWDTTKKCENKNLTLIFTLIQLFWNARDGKD